MQVGDDLQVGDGLKIVSIHLDGDGPKGPEPKDPLKKPPNLTIEQFLSNYITEEKLNYEKRFQDADIIVGDTNITESKTSVNLKPIQITQQIANALANIYKGKTWLVIQSNVSVGKVRKGFILLNDQIQKSADKNILNVMVQLLQLD